MTAEQRTQRLKAHPDTIALTFAGEERHWFLGRYAFQLAKKQGVAMGDILGQSQAENPADAVEEGFDRFALMLWAGFLPFDPELALEEVEMLLSIQEMNRLERVIAAPFAEFEGEESTAQGAPGAEGKGAKGKPVIREMS